MRNILPALLAFAICLLVSAEKKDKYLDWKTGEVVSVKTQDMQSSAYSNPNGQDRTGNGAILPGASNSGSAGGSFSSAPAHFIVYNLAFETEDEIFVLSLSREVTLRQPDLRVGTEAKYKRQGPKFFELFDSSGRKFEFKIEKVVAKEVAVPQSPK